MGSIEIFVFLVVCISICECESYSSCVTPMGEQGICVPLRLCPALKQAYCNGTESDQVYIEAFACKEGMFSVCCVTSQHTTTTRPRIISEQKPKYPKDSEGSKESKDLKPNKPVDSNNNKNRDLLPTKRMCGMQHSDDYLHEGNDTALDEFPWLVEIECLQTKRNSITKFPGVLLNTRYILSTHICHGNGKAVVTLGKISSDGASCLLTKFNEKQCPDPELKVNALESILKPDQKFSLLRLEKRLTYTDYIRPICLPFERRDKPRLHSRIISSGWGQLSMKKKLFYEVVNNDECTDRNIVPSAFKYLCAKRITAQNDVECRGDEGSPVWYKTKFNWYMVGMLGDPKCDSKSPVLTSLIDKDVTDWILSAIRA